MVAVLLTCALAAGAEALPLAGAGQSVAPLVQPVAHKPNEWHWHGHWWRPGPWSDHVMLGRINTRSHGSIFVPWGVLERLRYCAAKYHSFDPATRTYVTRHGERRLCH